MANLPKTIGSIKTNPDFTLVKAVGVGVAKSISERVLARTRVGNGTLKSGVIKMGLASLVFALSRKSSGLIKDTADVTSTGMTVDAVEDVINWAMVRWGSSGIQQTTQSNAI